LKNYFFTANTKNIFPHFSEKSTKRVAYFVFIEKKKRILRKLPTRKVAVSLNFNLSFVEKKRKFEGT